MSIVYDIRETKLGNIAIIAENEKIIGLTMNQENIMNIKRHNTKLIDNAFNQLNEYLENKRKIFDLPLKLNGTKFYVHVWEKLMTIPFGKTITYKDLAEISGKPLAFRAVGGAMRANNIPIFIPCHRVIKSNGDLGGYSCGLDIKKKLLRIEGINL